MNKKDIEIAKKTLKILSKKSWSSITYNEVLTGIKKIPKKNKNKNDLLKNINRYIDFLLKIDMKSIEISTKKDMLFEVVMARFDILQKNRKSILNIYKFYRSKPHKSLLLVPSFLESMILTAQLAKINTNGLNGSLKIKGIFLIYIATFFVWINDNTKTIEKTMTSLDNYIYRAERIIKNIV